MRRFSLRLLMAVSMLAGATAVHAPAASAGTVDAFCPVGTFHQTFEPGLRLDTREITVRETGTFVGCVSAARPEISWLDFAFSGVGRLNCLGGSADGLVTIRWRDVHGHLVGVSTGTVEFAVVLRPVGQNTVVVVLHITDGLFRGDAVVMDEVLLANPLACLTPDGVREQSGVGAGLAVIH